MHMTAAFYVILFGVFGGVSMTEAAILCICFGLTMGAELLNTAIERLCDKQASGYDGMVRNAKDIAAAGVFVCAAACVAVGACIFIGNGVLAAAIKFFVVQAVAWHGGCGHRAVCGLVRFSFWKNSIIMENGKWRIRARIARRSADETRARIATFSIFHSQFSILNYCTGDK